VLDKGADENSVSFFFAQKGGIIAKKYESKEKVTQKMSRNDPWKKNLPQEKQGELCGGQAGCRL
jgi:hypothetical protein